MKIKARELQSKGFKKSSISGLYLSSSGKAFNLNTQKELNPTKKGCVVILAKHHNLAKLILELYKKIPVRSGKVIFINGNCTDFESNNLTYAVETPYKAPTDNEIINCVRLYFEIPEKSTSKNILFRYYLKEIAMKRGFLSRFKGVDFCVFNEWVNDTLRSRKKSEISLQNCLTVVNGSYAINKYLGLLVNECLLDYENGILKMQGFEPKPMTATEKLKKANQSLKEMGLISKIPLRKKHNKT